MGFLKLHSKPFSGRTVFLIGMIYAGLEASDHLKYKYHERTNSPLPEITGRVP
jgi:hypothetical protein